MFERLEKYDVAQFSSDKILCHLDRVTDWLSGGNPFPITMELDLSNRCTHRCRECVSDFFQQRNGAMLSFDLASRIIRDLSERGGVRGLIFTGGGDPLTHPQVGECVILARDLGMDVGFITNAALLNEAVAEMLVRCCSWIRVSLDAATPDMFVLSHGRDAREFERVVENIRMLVRTRRRLKSCCTIGVGYLTSDDTRSEIARFAELGRELEVDYVQYRPLQIHLSTGTDYARCRIDEELEEALSFSTERYKVLFSKHKYMMMERRDYGRYYGKCYGQQFASTIAADGKVYVCCHMRGYEKYCLGDLNERSFAEVWDSQRRKQVVENIDFNDCIPLCRDNTFNQILWDMVQPREHENFL